jgi:glycosyltransferase involved in cell wall biosynthesis
MERYAYRGFDAVHVVAREDLRVLRALGANPKVVVIPNGVDTEYFAPDDGSVRTDTFRVGYLADFSGQRRSMRSGSFGMCFARSSKRYQPQGFHSLGKRRSRQFKTK